MSEVDKKASTVKEGKAKIILPKGVFYNPVQEFNRDLTVAVICGFQKLHEKAWKEKIKGNMKKVEEKRKSGEHEEYEGIKILEALAASGLRSTRFALEIQGVKEVIANDVDPQAAELIAVNAESNGSETKRLIKPTCKDANILMMEHKNVSEQFDVIDLDPYGSAAKFLPMAVASVSNGGILCITCTDAAVLCGSAGGTAFGRYGGVSIRCSPSHEMAIRILLHSIQHQAAVEGRFIQPILSLSADFYIRVFVRVFKGPGEAKLAACRTAIVYICNGCKSHYFQPLGRSEERPGGNVVILPSRGPPVGPGCENCGGHFNVAGPIWTAELHEVEFIEKLLQELRRSDQPESDSLSDFAGIFDKAHLKTKERIIGVLSVTAEELPDCPLYYRAEHLAKIVHCHVPPLIKLRSAILNSGYRVSSTHVDPVAFKTDAPPEVIWDIFRAWVKLDPIAERHYEDRNSTCARILNKDTSIEVSFEQRTDANPASRKEGLLRFQINPEKNWGPKARAKRNLGDEEGETMKEKRKRLQGKRRRTGDDSDVP